MFKDRQFKLTIGITGLYLNAINFNIITYTYIITNFLIWLITLKLLIIYFDELLTIYLQPDNRIDMKGSEVLIID